MKKHKIFQKHGNYQLIKYNIYTEIYKHHHHHHNHLNHHHLTATNQAVEGVDEERHGNAQLLEGQRAVEAEFHGTMEEVRKVLRGRFKAL